MQVYFKIERKDGRVEELLNPKFNGWNDRFMADAKKAYVARGEQLLQVRTVAAKWVKNPKWKEYNDFFNEGGEGYNPHNKLINSGMEEVIYNE